MIKTCAVCGAEFTSATWNATYCSTECRKTAKNEAQNKARAEARAAENRPCAACGKQMPPELNRNRLYCSEECQQEGKNRKHREWDKTPKGQACRKRAKAKANGGKPPTPKATDVYTPDDAARARGAVTNEFRDRSRLLMGF